MYQCIAISKLNRGYMDEVLKAAKNLAEVARSEKGIIYYNVLKPAGTEDTLIFIEKWETEADFRAHVQGSGTEDFGKLMSVAEESAQIFPCELVI